jgi:hypothetical protein
MGAEMKRDRNYDAAVSQVGERLKEATELLGDVTRLMLERNPADAWFCLDVAKASIEGAMTTAKWATTLPAPEED